MIVEVKPSTKFNPFWFDAIADEITSLGESRKISDVIFYTPFSQINLYMTHSGADYADPLHDVLLTDQYLVPIKREGSTFGKLHVGKPVPWCRYYQEDEDVTDFTIQSALWYMCMLASLPDWHYQETEIDFITPNLQTQINIQITKQEK